MTAVEENTCSKKEGRGKKSKNHKIHNFVDGGGKKEKKKKKLC